MPGVAIGSNVSLLVAALDLKLVQLVRQAMRAADQQAGAPASALGPAPTPEPRRVIHPEERFEPRPVIRPTPRFEPRPVIYPKPRIAPRPVRGDPAPAETVVRKEPAELPLQPPWAKLPWQNPPSPAPKIKLAPPHPDIVRRGELLDFFI